MNTSNLNGGPDRGTEKSEDERRLLPMLIAGLVLIVVGMIAVMTFV